MTELITLLIFNSLLIVGIYNAVDYDYDVDKKPTNKKILWWVSYYTRKFPKWTTNPIYGCILCMASFHSIYIYWFMYDFTIYNAVIYLFYIFALSGLNSLIYAKFFE